MKKGFTLVEVMITSAILVVLVAGIFSAIYVGEMSGGISGGVLDLQQEARRALSGMMRELRQTRSGSVTISSNNTRVTFNIPTSISSGAVIYSSGIVYYLDSAARRIYRLYGSSGTGSTRVIGQNVQALQFNCLGGANSTDCGSSNMIEISIVTNTTARGRHFFFNLTETGRMRNG
jgi:prepilin-type N-terminal cleavage/methylation domain-containing protein